MAGKAYDKIVGIDLGNGMVKVRTVDSKNRPYHLVLPSAWAYKKDAGINVHSKTLSVDEFEIDDITYLWGDDVAEISAIKDTYGHDNRYKTEAFRIMAKIVMAKIVADTGIKPTDKIMVVTGVPSGESNTARENEIREAFIGDTKGLHEVSVNGEEQIFKVAYVEVQSQAVASVLGRYLDEDGYVADEEYEHMKVAVIDIGAGTTDLDIVDGLRRQPEYLSVQKGFRDVYDSIRADIRKVYPSHSVTDYELLKAMDRGKTEYKPSKIKSSVDFEKAMNDGIMEVVVDVQQAIMSKWKNQTDLDEILLVGGGANLFEEKLSNVVEGLTIPENFSTSNVEGYYRYGVYLATNGLVGAK